MNYKAFYRTYRPTKFDDVVGQDHITKTLVNIIKMKKISHGYLFSGPRGTGKTSVAKIFANAINCIHTEFPEQICQSCLNNSNNSLDVIEIDAASNNGVNDIRTIREQVNFTPTNHPYKIYIIDEVHMLSKGAFNALLMTLEEPPQHAIFIFATTDPDKIPDTILSRVQRYNFKRITKLDLIDQLKFIFNKEKVKYDHDSLDLIASLANGSLRDALSIADQVNAYSNSNISSKDIIEIFGLTTIPSQIKLINLCVNKDVGHALEYFNELTNSGVDVSKLVVSLINLLKDFLVFKKTGNANLIETTNEEMILDLLIKSDFVYKYLEILTPLSQEIKYSDIPQQLFQLAIIKFCSIEENLKDVTIQKKSINSIENNKNPNQNEKTFDDSEKIQDITEHLFITEADKKNTTNDDKTILSDFSTNILKNRLNSFVENEFKNNLDNENNTNTNTISEELELSHPKTKTIELEKEQKRNYSDTDELIQQTTAILNIANEENGIENELNEVILDSTQDLDFSNTKPIYDTNEISLSDLAKEQKNTNWETTSEFKVNKLNEDIQNKANKESKHEEVIEYKLTQPNIVNLFLQADKSSFPYFKEKLIKASLSSEDEYDIFSTLLKEVKFVCSSSDFVLVSSMEDWVINDLSNFEKDFKFKKFINDFFGNDVYFFAITKSEYENSKKLFEELKKTNNIPKIQKLPNKKEENNYNDNGIEIHEKHKESELKAKALFGNLFKKKN